MPLYEYRCGACGHEFEVLQKISDRPIRKCERCGRLKAKRAISQTSFVLKGSGWYVTDYGGRKSGTSREKSSESKSSGEAEGKSSKSDGSSDSSSSSGPTQKSANA
jgi:putative FmdB family regulatory protein